METEDTCKTNKKFIKLSLKDDTIFSDLFLQDFTAVGPQSTYVVLTKASVTQALLRAISLAWNILVFKRPLSNFYCFFRFQLKYYLDSKQISLFCSVCSY